MNKNENSITIRCTTEQKIMIKKAALERNKSLKDYVLELIEADIKNSN